MDKIGITERGDAGLDFSWVESVPETAITILITKNLNDRFIKEVVKQKNKLIVHATITGMGGTQIEPNVPSVDWSINQLKNLIKSGFPACQIVLRIDPIFPTEKGLQTARSVLVKASGLGITRCRISVVDTYKHVVKRFAVAKLPFPEFDLQKAYDLIVKTFSPYFDRWDFEACAEGLPFRRGCISNRDAVILGIDVDMIGNKEQRKGCLCPKNKLELLGHCQRCQHQCLYCYWCDSVQKRLEQ